MSLKLSPAEERLIEIIWTNEKIFMNKILESYPDPKPAPSTISTLLKRMREKGFVDYKLYGNSRQYFPIVKKRQYFKDKLGVLVNKFFGGSNAAFASFFTEESKMNTEELKKLKELIDRKIQDQK